MTPALKWLITASLRSRKASEMLISYSLNFADEATEKGCNFCEKSYNRGDI
ncbi:hypothetical protein [Phormidesmis priestleyi]